MYWLYSFLFIVAILTPVVVEGEAWHLTEDFRESIVILISGALAFMLYALKEKSLIRHVREKLWFQQKTTTISKDLTQSYSYIGEVNRKVDILQGMMRRLVEIRETKQSEERMLWEILDTIKHLTQADRASIRIFTSKACTHRLEEKADKKIFAEITDAELLKNGKNFFEISGIQGVSSQDLRKKTKVFVLLSRAHNDEIDEDILNILLSLLAILDTFLVVDKKAV